MEYNNNKIKLLDLSIENNFSIFPNEILSAIEIMESNLEEPLNLKELSVCVNKSRRQFERSFKKYIRESPSRYYMNIRLNKARQLLECSNKSVTEISVLTGFANVGYFCTCFKKFFGGKPKEIRDAILR